MVLDEKIRAVSYYKNIIRKPRSYIKRLVDTNKTEESFTKGLKHDSY
jgi:hypothetical protein